MSRHIKQTNEGSFEQVVLQSDRPVLVDFWAEWCGPCRRLAPITETVADRYAGAVQVAKLNVDENPAIAARHHIQGIPTLILFQNGEERERIIGAASEEDNSRAIGGHVSSAASI